MLTLSDAVFAVLITILVLDMKPPHGVGVTDLLTLWPTSIAYGLSYLFIATVWVNHHHLLAFFQRGSSSLLWANLGHLFSVSLLPFTTEWMAESRLSAWPVAIYAAVFALVNATYLLLSHEVFNVKEVNSLLVAERIRMRRRSSMTLCAFVLAGIIAVWYPIGGLVVIVTCMAMYLRHSDPIGFV
ncbi:DUF1211 domain-containing protein [Dyella sp. 7MK23]|uniref:DUF1211 domain-containing protein n=2 Tax=Dyella acidiphila TaxID=2775866 RepID=A0ABR9GEM2_9GAMM|nr:DUF1211 domain-containing protein [Dyella acidiphila]